MQGPRVNTLIRNRPIPSRTRLRIAATLLGLSAGVGLALWLAPASRWLVRLQTTLALPTHLATATPPELNPFAAGGQRSPESEAAFRHAADRLSTDAEVQLAFNVRNLTFNDLDAPRRGALRALAPLADRFPNNPCIVAAILRHGAGPSVQLRRAELAGVTDTLDTPHDTITDRAPPEPVSTRTLALFDRIAANGERDDPSNAFFPAIRAAGHFDAGKDDEALACLARAAAMPIWNEYVAEEVRGAWRLGDSALGPNNTLARASLLVSISFKHYAVMKDIAKIAVLSAMNEERSGHPERAADIRLNVMRIGALMRSQSTTFVGSATGTAIQDIAISRPNGVKPARVRDAVALRHAAFVNYLRDAGHAADIPWVKAQFDAREKMWKALSLGFDRFDITRGITTFGQWVIGGLVLLDSALWVLLLGLLSAALGRLVDQKRLPAHPKVTWRTGAGAAVVFVSALFWFLTMRLTTTPRVLLECVAVIAVCVFIYLMFTTGWRGLMKALLIALATLPIAAVLAAGVLWLGRGFAAADALLSPNVAAAYSAPDSAPGLVALGLVVALLPAFLLGIALRVRRAPFIPGMLHEYASLALPVVCALLLVYGGIAVKTTRMGVAINANLEKMVQHEGRFYADLAHQTWPE